MILIGLVLLVLALVVPQLAFLLWVGVVLLVVGLVLAGTGHYGHPVGGRRHYW